MVKKVVKLIESKNFSINNIDINIIAQKPKIKKYSKKMIQTISKLCEINPNEIIGLTNSDITPSEVLEIYKKYFHVA